MRIPVTVALLGAAAVPATAAVHEYGSLAIAPAGDVVATVEAANRDAHAAITLRTISDGKVVFSLDPCATCTYSGLTFAPGGALAFVARDRKAGTVTLMVSPRRGPARIVAVISGIAQTPRFSPDGKRLALLVTLGATKEAGATQAGARLTGEIGEKSDEQRLAIFDVSQSVEATNVRPLSPDDRYIYEYDWAPDGLSLVVTSALGNGDANWWVATLDAVDAATGSVRNIAKPKTQINSPRVTADGRSVAYIGGLMSDFGSVGGDVWTVPLTGGRPINLTAGVKWTATSLASTRAGLIATRLASDEAGVVAIPLRGAALWARPATFAAGDGKVVFSADGRTMATVVQDFTHAPSIYAGPVATPRQITHENDALPATVVARSVTWRNEGFTVQGWLLSPTTAVHTVKAPMIVDVHGGPSAASVPRFYERGPDTALLDAGYHVFLPNPRGSYGQGQDFTSANKRDFGGGDLRDILAGIDAVERVAAIDEARLGLQGCSYGGFMAMWANTQTNRFKAIVAGAGLSNWVSYYGTNGIDQWMLPFFGKSVYQDYKAYQDVSAVYHVATASTPTFIYVGERDIEVPPTQSVEWWHALKDRGVDTSLVIYPDAGHCVPVPEQRADVRARSIAWFNRYLKVSR